MKLLRREPSPLKRPLRAREVIHPIEEKKDESIFDPVDFLTPGEWEELGTTVVTMIEQSPEQYVFEDTENFLLSCLALSILKPETLEQIRASIKAKQTIQAVLSQVEQFPERPGKVSLAPVACWLWPDLAATPKIAEQMEKFEKKLARKDLKAIGLQAVLHPEQREMVGLNETWKKRVLKFMGNKDNDLLLDDILYLATPVFYPPEQPKLHESIALEKKDLKLCLAERRSEGSFVFELGWTLLPLARLRCLMAADKVYTTQGIIIHDRKPPLASKKPLPERGQV